MTIPLATSCGVAVAATIFAGTVPPWRRAALWVTVAALGHGAALSLTVAGPVSGYQHYLPFHRITNEHPWLLTLIAGQAIAVAAAWAGRWRRPGSTGIRITPWRIAAALILGTITAATVSPDVRRFVSELAFAISIQIVAIATILLAILETPGRPAARTATPGAEDTPAGGARKIDRGIWGAAAAAVVVTAILNVTAYGRHPHVPDEVVYLYHAKYLATGVLTLPALDVPAAFDVDLMEYEPTRWFSPVLPGWPFVLTIGAWVGLPWLVNPVLAGINVILAFLVLSEIYSRRVARPAALLLATSPWFLFLGMSFMTHQLTLCFALVAALAVATARKSQHAWFWGAIAGTSLGITTLIRPLDGATLGLVIGVWALGFGGKRLALPALISASVAAIATAAVILPYNRMMTGDPFKAPIIAFGDKHFAPNANAYGFGPDRGMGWPTDPNPGHSLFDAAINLDLNTFALNTDLFGWCTGSLILIAWLFCSGRWKKQDTLMLALALSFPLVHIPYYFSGGPDFGARYWFPIVLALVALTVRGVEALEEFTARRAWPAVAAMCAMALVTYIPWRSVDKYQNYRGMRPDVRALATTHGFGADLVLVSGRRFPDYASAFALNPIDLHEASTIYAWDKDSDTRRAVLRAYSDRRVWLVDGPSITKAGYRVVKGPVPAAVLLEAGQ